MGVGEDSVTLEEVVGGEEREGVWDEGVCSGVVGVREGGGEESEGGGGKGGVCVVTSSGGED
ncbi:hypothetical protein, partial [Dermacoccus nishinomiyaensis]|uniref:hypothetical protein n=1 Tax=Dermacoccus nishinomiyaensis TaxID=1274 RepID=UPI001C92D937